MVAKKSKYDSKAAIQWLNQGLSQSTRKASSNTTSRHSAEWSNISSFSLKDKEAVKKAKEALEKFESKYSTPHTDKSCISTPCEYSEVELYVQLLEDLEEQVDKIKQQLHHKKTEIENRISNTDHYVFYNIEYKKLLHDVVYSTKKTEDLVKAVSSANLIEDKLYCEHHKNREVMILKANQVRAKNFIIHEESIINMAIDFHYPPHMKSHCELENYILHIPFFRSAKENF